MDGDSESVSYEVETIIAVRKRGRSTEFYVQWKDYGSEENSWEPKCNLDGCTALIDEFLANTEEGKQYMQSHGGKTAQKKRKRAQDTGKAKDESSPATSSPDAKRKCLPPNESKETTQTATATPPMTSQNPKENQSSKKKRSKKQAQSTTTNLKPDAPMPKASATANSVSLLTPGQSPAQETTESGSASKSEVKEQAVSDAKPSSMVDAEIAEPAAPNVTTGPSSTDDDDFSDRLEIQTTSESSKASISASNKQTAGARQATVAPPPKQKSCAASPASTKKAKVNLKIASLPTRSKSDGSSKNTKSAKGAQPMEEGSTSPHKMNHSGNGEEPMDACDAKDVSQSMVRSVKDTTTQDLPLSLTSPQQNTDTNKDVSPEVATPDKAISLKAENGHMHSNGVNGGLAVKSMQSCDLTPLTSRRIGGRIAGRTPGVANVLESCSQPLWKAPISTGEQTRALLIVDVVQQQGSLRQPHATGPDPFTENWVKSLEGVELLDHEDTINQNFTAENTDDAGRNSAATSSKNTTPLPATNTTFTLPAQTAPPTPPKADQQKDGSDKHTARASDSSSEGLDLPFGTTLPSGKSDENNDYDFEDYQENENGAPDKGNTPPMDLTPEMLVVAAMEGNCSMLRRAFHHKMNLNHIVDSKGASLLIVAIQYGQEDVVQLLLNCPGTSMQAYNGETPLMVAAQRNRHSICARLIRAGAELNTQTQPAMETAVIMACKRDHVKTVEVLLRSGCDLSLRDSRSMAVLDHVQNVPFSSLDFRIKKYIARMTDYLLNTVTQRVEPESVPEQPPLVGFRSFGSSPNNACRITFTFEKAASPVNIRLFLLRGRQKQDGTGTRITWAECGTVSQVRLNGEEAKPQVRHSMYQLWPRIGFNEIIIKLSNPSMLTHQAKIQPLDRFYACVYNIKKHMR